MMISGVLILCFGPILIAALPESRIKRELSDRDRIHNAIFSGNDQKLDELIKTGIDINIKNNDGWTPLIIAASLGRDKIIELLIKNGAELEAKSQFGYTALHVAVQEGFEKTTEILLKNGADINTKNNDGWTPLITASSKGLGKMVEFLIRKGADVNIKTNYGYAPLHVAVQEGHEEIVKLLQRNHADIKIENNDGATPLDIALAKTCQAYLVGAVDRVLNGELVEKSGEFPWMVALGYIDINDYKVSFDCGGTIISDTFILTAAHCVKSRLPVIVRLGKLTLTDADGVKSVNRQIKEIIPHPDHSLITKKNDIALIRLKNSIQFSETISPACLQSDLRDENADTKLIVTGWGSTSSERTNRSNELRRTQLISMPFEECNTTLFNYNLLGNLPPFRNGIIQGQYCAYDPQAKNDSCQGDSGGPLQYFPNNSKFANVIGIVSFGVSCGTELPSIYTRVAYYLEWIESIVWPNL